MKKIFYLFICQLLYSNVYSQQWHMYYAGLYLNGFIELQDKRILLTGSSFGWTASDSTNIILISTDSSGNINWSKGYGSNREEYSSDIIQCPDSGFLIVGNTNGFNSHYTDVLLIKTDKNGNVEWSQAYGGDALESPSVILPTSDKGFIIGGNTLSHAFLPGGNIDVFLLSVDSLGNLKWLKSYGDNGDNYLYDLEYAPDSGLLILSRTGNYSSNGLFNNYLIKTDKNGIKLWESGIGSNDMDYPAAMCQTPDAGYIICGYVWTSDADIYAIKLDSNRMVQWAKKFGSGTDHNFARDIRLTADSGYILLGTSDLLTETVTSILRLDKYGDTLWTRTYSEYQWDSGIKIKESRSRYLIQTETFLFTTDTFGQSICNQKQLIYYWANLVASDYNTFPYAASPYWNNIRSVVVDTLGGVTGSNVCQGVGVSENTDTHTTLLLFPNPFSGDELNISIAGNEELYAYVTIMDTYGREVIKQYCSISNNDFSSINLPDKEKLMNGTYLVLVRLSDKMVHSKLIVCR